MKTNKKTKRNNHYSFNRSNGNKKYYIIILLCPGACLVCSYYDFSMNNYVFLKLDTQKTSSKLSSSSFRWMFSYQSAENCAVVKAREYKCLTYGMCRFIMQSCILLQSLDSLAHSPPSIRRKLCKTLWEKEKMLVTSIFSFSHSVFYLSNRKILGA